MTSTINWYWHGYPREVVQARKMPEKLAFLVNKYNKLAQKYPDLQKIAEGIQDYLNSYTTIKKELKAVNSKPKTLSNGQEVFDKGNIRSSLKDCDSYIGILMGCTYAQSPGKFAYYKDLSAVVKPNKEALAEAQEMVRIRGQFWQLKIDHFNQWADIHGLPNISRRLVDRANCIDWEPNTWFKIKEVRTGSAVQCNDDKDFWKRTSFLNNDPLQTLTYDKTFDERPDRPYQDLRGKPLEAGLNPKNPAGSKTKTKAKKR